MFNYLKGRLVETLPGKAVLDIGGVGFSLEIPPSEDDHLRSMVGEEITLYTRLIIRDEDIYIYAFRAAEQRKLFNMILAVSGFGPRLALSVLAVFTVSEFYVAVLEENVAQLCRAHGVGRKAAQRLILELKEKLPGVISAEQFYTGPASVSGSSVIVDITEALYTLGYSGTEASEVVRRVVDQNRDLPREEILKLVLKNMASG